MAVEDDNFERASRSPISPTLVTDFADGGFIEQVGLGRCCRAQPP
jgi:hypothetical protein